LYIDSDDIGSISVGLYCQLKVKSVDVDIVYAESMNINNDISCTLTVLNFVVPVCWLVLSVECL